MQTLTIPKAAEELKSRAKVLDSKGFPKAAQDRRDLAFLLQNARSENLLQLRKQLWFHQIAICRG
jgi:hypothetical protein